MSDAQYDVILKEIRDLAEKVQGTRTEIAELDRDLTRDRQEIGDTKVALSSLKEEVAQLRKTVNISSEDVERKVSDVVDPASERLVDAVKDLNQEIKTKKTISFLPPKEKRGGIPKGLIFLILKVFAILILLGLILVWYVYF